LYGEYELIIATKEPWRLGLGIGACKALIATGRKAFVKLRESAGVYGELLDLLRAHKWIYIKLATDDGFRAAAKQNKNSITVEGIVMYLELVSGRGGSLVAKYFTRDVGRALAAADKLKAAGLRPNIVKSGPNYVVYIATADLLKLAERDGEIRRAIALYLAEKAKDGTPRQREIAEKILRRHPLFNLPMSFCFFEVGAAEVGVFGRRLWNRGVSGGGEADAPNLASYGADMPHSRHAELATYVQFRQKPERVGGCGGI